MNLDQFTKNGKYLMLALDHRGSFKKLMNPENTDSVNDGQVVALKKDIIDSVEDQFSGLLIDATYGLKAYPGKHKPFLLPVEKTGYIDRAGERVTELEYSVQQLKDLGASGAKILLYFNPNIESAKAQLETAKKIIQECRVGDLPLFLEIVVYDRSGKVNEADRPKLVLDSVKKFKEEGVIPDVFKLEYPGNEQACEEITKTCRGTPWILLTKGDTYEVFRQELAVAIRAGAAGFLAGRALWQEVCILQGLEKEEFLKTTLPDRFRSICKISNN